MFILFNLIFSFGARLLDALLGTNYSDAKPMDGGYIYTLYSLVLIVPSITITVRRLHDIGKSGWFYFWTSFALIVAAIGYVVYIVVTLMNSGAGDLDSLKAGDFDTSALLAGNFILYTILFVVFILAMSIWLLVLLTKRGDTGDNKYGPDPLATPAE